MCDEEKPEQKNEKNEQQPKKSSYQSQVPFKTKPRWKTSPKSLKSHIFNQTNSGLESKNIVKQNFCYLKCISMLLINKSCYIKSVSIKNVYIVF